MTAEEPPTWFPYLVRMAIYPSDTKETGSSSELEKLYRRFEGVYSGGTESLEMGSGAVMSAMRHYEDMGSRLFLLASGSARVEDPNHVPEYGLYEERIERLREALRKEPEFTFTLRFAYATDEGNAESILQRYMEREGRHARGSGLVRRSLLASLRKSGGGLGAAASRDLIAIQFGKELETSDSAWALCSEIRCLALHLVEMSRLHSGRRLMFEQLDASERSTQLRLNEILADMRRPMDEIQPSDLEEILREITIQFSRLSTLASSMRRDHVKAQGLLRGVRRLLDGWNERPLGEGPTNSSAELREFESLLAPFGDFIERTEAMSSQLNTALDSVRTYLGIQQQKLSIAEQASSREQLVRLVNLQEILHKLEVLIVAVYLTEMARIVFETSFHESANLLTALFIPASLLISILISRMLHKHR